MRFNQHLEKILLQYTIGASGFISLSHRVRSLWLRRGRGNRS